ncbi:extensin isoform X2 [Ixodes scapularis]
MDPPGMRPKPPVPVFGPASADTTNPDPEGQRPDSGLSPQAPPPLPEGPVLAGSPLPLPEGPAEVEPVPEENAQPSSTTWLPGHLQIAAGQLPAGRPAVQRWLPRVQLPAPPSRVHQNQCQRHPL